MEHPLLPKDAVPNPPSQSSVTTASPPSRWLSIRWALPVIMLLPLVTGIGLTSWLAFHSGRAAVRELIQEVSGEVTNRIEQQLSDRISDDIDMLEALVSSQFETGTLSPTDPAGVRQYFWQLIKVAPDSINAFIYSDDQGRFIQVKRLQNDSFDFSLRDASTGDRRHIYSLDESGAIVGPPQIQDYDHRQRHWYEDALTAEGSVWSEIYQSATPPDLTMTRATLLSSPRFAQRTVIGIDVHLQSLSNFLKKLDIGKTGKTGRAFVIERSQGTEDEWLLVATSEGMPFRTAAAAQGTPEVTRIAATASTDMQIRETALYLKEHYGSFEQVPDEEPISFRHEGQTYWADIEPFPDQNLDWLVVVTIPENDFTESINKSMGHTLMLGGLITGAVSLGSVLLSLWLVRPISRLKRAADAIKQHQFQEDELVDIAQRPDELGELAKLFNDMALVVTSREQGLEEQVASLRSEIDRYGRIKTRESQSDIKILHQAQKVRQEYQRQHPELQDRNPSGPSSP